MTTQSRDFRNPQAWNWNVIVERDFFFKSVLSVGYVGRRGLHQQREANINQPTIDTIKANSDANGNLLVNIDSLRPYKGYNSVRETDNIASSRYNSLQVSWNRRFSGGLLFGGAYTYSKSMDDGSNQRDIIPNTYSAQGLWAPSDFDRRQILIVNFLYELPFLRNQSNLAGKVAGGWQISGIFQASTGNPAQIGRNQDYAKVGVDGSMNGSQLQYWNFAGGSINYTKQMAHNGSSEGSYWICGSAEFQWHAAAVLGARVCSRSQAIPLAT